MPNRDTIVIGASAGGIESLQNLLPNLPKDLHASVHIVVHISRESTALHRVLGKDSGLPVCRPEDSSPRKHGCLYIAPPDYHMLLVGDDIRLVQGPKENRNRPAIDPLFRSAAWSLGPRVIGIILSGNLDDGVAGLWAIKFAGGVTIVQNPDETMYPGMSKSALRHVEVDYCCPVEDMAPLISHLTRVDLPVEPGNRSEEHRFETEMLINTKGVKHLDSLGSPSGLTCPTCHGALWEIREGNLTRYRCHTGHGFSSETLLEEQSDAVEDALYSALRSLKEKVAAIRSVTGTDPEANAEQISEARMLDEQTDTIKSLLVTRDVNDMESGNISESSDISESYDEAAAPISSELSKRRRP